MTRYCVLLLALLPFSLVTGVVAAADAGDTPETNLALGKTFTLAPRPEYQHCTDPGDDVQLTDGQLTEGYFWVQKGTVGWTHVPCAAITVDLGRVEPISGVSLRTAAGAAGVSWPAAVRIAVSDDGKQFRDVGDLVAMDLAKQGAWPEGYAVRRLVTHDLTTRGRFVQLLIVTAGGGFVFADEVEVFRGPDALLQADPGGKPVGDVAERITEMKLVGGIRRRFASDVAGLRRAIDETPGVDEPVKRELLARADEVGKKLASSPFVPEPTFRAVSALQRPARRGVRDSSGVVEGDGAAGASRLGRRTRGTRFLCSPRRRPAPPARSKFTPCGANSARRR